jgi:hypothetical protein
MALKQTFQSQGDVMKIELENGSTDQKIHQFVVDEQDYLIY